MSHAQEDPVSINTLADCQLDGDSKTISLKSHHLAPQTTITNTSPDAESRMSLSEESSKDPWP